MNLVVRTLAAEDLLLQHEYLWVKASLSVADRFLLAANEAFERLL